MNIILFKENNTKIIVCVTHKNIYIIHNSHKLINIKS